MTLMTRRKNQIATKLLLTLAAVAVGSGSALAQTSSKKLKTTPDSNSNSKLEASAPKQTTWQKIRKRTRASIFSEIMTPSFETQTPSAATPLKDGKPNDPINAFTIFQADYEFLSNTRFLYFQRMPYNFNKIPGAEGNDLTFSDPRFALRLTNFIPSKSIISTVDFYTQPGFSKGSANIERKGDLGIQTNIKYKNSGWTVGNILDVRHSFFLKNGKGNDWTGFAAPYITKDLNSKWSTQTWFSFPWKHARNTDIRMKNMLWNSPGSPYIQNGLGYSATDSLWVGALVNNFILVKPTLQNTWASLWISVTLL